MGEQNFNQEDRVAAATEAWKLSETGAAVLLAANQEHGAHGYDMTLTMRRASTCMEGLEESRLEAVVKNNGGVYRIIKRFVREKLIEPHTPPKKILEKSKGPKRKYYKTTELGAKILEYNVELSRQKAALYDAPEEPS